MEESDDYVRLTPGLSVPANNAFSTLRHADFRKLWLADTLSILGWQIQRMAITWQVYELTGDALLLGLLGLIRFAPVIIFGLFGGVVADRGDRRMILVWTHIALLVSSVVLVLATASGHDTLLVIYAVTFASAAINALAGPARQALIPNLVPRSELAGAATMANLAMQAASVVGPAVGGILIASTSLAIVYGLNAIGFLAVIVAALAIKARPEIHTHTERGLTAIKAGFVFLWQTPILLTVMGLDFIATFFGAFSNLLPIFADEIFGGGANRLGLLLSAPAAGAVVGSLVFGLMRMPVRPGLGMVACVIGYGACIVGFGLSSNLWLALLFLAGTGAADSISMAMRHTIRNLVTPDAYRGRIASAHSMFAMGGPQLGEFRAGIMASTMGAPAAVAIGGVGTILAAIGAVRMVPQLASRLADLPEVEEPEHIG